MPIKQVLVIDDSREVRELLKALLQFRSFAVVEAENGQQALGKLTQAPFSLIITDYNMPVMNGLEFITALKRQSPQSVPPVILITAADPAYLAQAAQAAGAAKCLGKPFSFSAFLTAVDELTATQALT